MAPKMDLLKPWETFLDFLEFVLGLSPFLFSKVFPSPVHSPLLPVLCRLNVRGRVRSGSVGETKRKSHGQREEDVMNLCDYRHLLKPALTENL